jgi:hypothetical protein
LEVGTLSKLTGIDPTGVAGLVPGWSYAVKAYAIDLALVVSQPHGGEPVQVEALREQESPWADRR